MLSKFCELDNFSLSNVESHDDRAPQQLQQVSTIAKQKLVVTWMVQNKIVNDFPCLFECTIATSLEHFQAQKYANAT